MIFPGAWVYRLDDGVEVDFMNFDDTDLSEVSNWTEAWQNEDPALPAGFVQPAMIVAEAGRRLLEGRPQLKQALEAFVAAGKDTNDRNQPARVCQVRTAEEFGLFCLSMCESLEHTTRVRSKPPAPVAPDAPNEEIPF